MHKRNPEQLWLKFKHVDIPFPVDEHIFDRLLSGIMVKSSKANETLRELKKIREKELPLTQAWEASILGLRATYALKDEKSVEVNQLLDQTVKIQNEALAAALKDVGVHSVVGGTWVVSADRFAVGQRKHLWQTALASYKSLAQIQELVLLKLPEHHRGEVLTGMVQAAQRTDDTATFDKYFPIAQESLLTKWASDHALRDRTNIACKSFHEPGKLETMCASAR